MRPETLHEQLFFATVRITTEAPGAHGVGTGFVYDVATSATETASFLVTNKHVVAGATSATLHFMRSQDAAMSTPALGGHHTVTVPDPGAAFIGHPDPHVDVAIAPITPWVGQLRDAGLFVFYRSIGSSMALNSTNVTSLDALEEITFVGYPNGLYDEVNGLPIMRRGITASPVAVDYMGRAQFLVDASVFPGSSGSPVLIAESGSYSPRGGGLVLGSRALLLGILAAVYEREVPVVIVPTANLSVRDPLNIGIVYKASTIDDLIDQVLKQHGLKRHVEPAAGIVVPGTTGDALTV